MLAWQATDSLNIKQLAVYCRDAWGLMSYLQHLQDRWPGLANLQGSRLPTVRKGDWKLQNPLPVTQSSVYSHSSASYSDLRYQPVVAHLTQAAKGINILNVPSSTSFDVGLANTQHLPSKTRSLASAAAYKKLRNTSRGPVEIEKNQVPCLVWKWTPEVFTTKKRMVNSPDFYCLLILLVRSAHYSPTNRQKITLCKEFVLN